MKNFSSLNRSANIIVMSNQSQSSQEPFDLVIIGGGINGAGAARDAALRGMRVALIEAGDFASGTSSKSSKLIHGGIRYLENMEFKLVFEALNERTKLFSMAPHLVHPLRFMIPIYKSSRVGMLLMGLGMWLYDALSLFQAPMLHERLNAKKSLERMPALASKDLLGSYVYSDAYMDDDRLVIETLRSANEHGALCANYVKAIGLVSKEGENKTVLCQDQLSGKKFQISAKHIISTVGPWTDDLGEKMIPSWKKILRPTKGIHLTLSKERLPLTSAVVMGAEKSDRIVFAIPRHEMVIIGTTDTDYKDQPENVSASTADVEYLLDITAHYFPGAKITRDDIVATYAGIRPLVKDESSNEGKTSREHTIFSHKVGVTFVAGGKYTTYRLISEEVVDAALKFFSFEEQMSFRKQDTSLPLNPLASEESYNHAMSVYGTWSKRFKVSDAEALKLAERHGMEGLEILLEYGDKLSYWQLEAAHAISKEMCLSLEDFYRRRSPLYLAEKDHGLRFLPEITKVFEDFLFWSEVETQTQIQGLHAFIEKDSKW